MTMILPLARQLVTCHLPCSYRIDPHAFIYRRGVRQSLWCFSALGGYIYNKGYNWLAAKGQQHQKDRVCFRRRTNKRTSIRTREREIKQQQQQHLIYLPQPSTVGIIWPVGRRLKRRLLHALRPTLWPCSALAMFAANLCAQLTGSVKPEDRRVDTHNCSCLGAGRSMTDS